MLAHGKNIPKVKTPRVGPPNVPRILITNDKIVSAVNDAAYANPAAIVPIIKAGK